MTRAYRDGTFPPALLSTIQQARTTPSQLDLGNAYSIGLDSSVNIGDIDPSRIVFTQNDTVPCNQCG
jgi:hypothetical protein